MRNDAVLQPRDSAHQSDSAATVNNPIATVQAMSWRRRRLAHRSAVMRPKARATSAEAADRAVFNVTAMTLEVGGLSS